MQVFPPEARPDASGATPTVPPVLLRDLAPGPIDQVVLVRGAERRRKKDGSTFLRVTVGDRTGTVAAMVWDHAEELAEQLTPGAVVRARGTLEDSPRYGRQLKVEAWAPAPAGSYDPADLRDGPPRPFERMESDLEDLLDTVQDPHLRALLDAVLGADTETGAAFRIAPAAKRFHQAYQHGLLEHSLSVAQSVSAISATFPGIDREVAVTGALLHDIGKLEAYTLDPDAPDMTDLGRLQGEIPLGYYRIRRLIEDLPGFPAATAEAILHIILSHHGTLEHGSPVVPCTREATLVHMIDNLGGRLGSFDRLEKELPPGAEWSGFDRALSGSAYFPHREGTGPGDSSDVAAA